MIRVVLRVLGVGLRALGTLVLVVLLLVASLLVHLDTPVVRRVAVARVNQLVFKPLFRGDIEIAGLAHVDPFGVRGASFRVKDPSGNLVLFADGIDGRFGTIALLESLLRDPRDIVVDVPRVEIHHVDVRLDLDDGGMALANAFFPKTPSTEPPTPFDGHGVHVFIPRIRIDHAWGHGQMTGLPYFDGDLTALDAGFVLEPNGLTVTAHHGQIVGRGIALGADAKGAFGGVFQMSLDADPIVMGGHAHWDGTAGTLPEKATFAIEKGRFDATLDVSEATPDAIRSLWPSSPIAAPGSAHLEAHGPLTAIELAAHAGLGAATVDVDGELAWSPVPRASIHVEADGVDLHQLTAGAPASHLGVKGDVAATLAPDGKLEGHAELDFPSGQIGPHPVPPVTLRATAFRQTTGAFGGDATVVAEEPGAPTTITLHATPTAHAAKVDFDIQSHDVRLGALRRLTGDLKGSARIVGKGNIDLENLGLNASIDTHGETFTRGPLQVGSATLTGRAHGHLLDPRVDVDLHAERVAWQALRLSSIDVSVHGPAMKPHVTVREKSEDLPAIDAEADLDVLDGPTIRQIDVHARRKGEAARLRADRVRFTPGNIAVDGVRIDGLGSPAEASFDFVGDTVRLRVKAPGLEAARVAKLAGLEALVHGGTLSIDADVSVRPDGASGRAKVLLEDGDVGTVGAISARIDGELTGRKFVGDASAAAGELGFLALKGAKISVGGTGPLARASWKKLFGDVDLDGRVDLARIFADIPAADRPLASLRGTVTLKGRLQRDSSDDFTPLIDLNLATSGLFLTGKPTVVATKDVTPSSAPSAPPEVGVTPTPPSSPSAPSAPAGAPSIASTIGNAAASTPTQSAVAKVQRPSWTLQGVDLTTTIHVNGDTGFTQVESHVRDAHGEMAIFNVESSAVPYAQLFAAPETALATLEHAAFEARLSIPSQALATWPAGILQLPVDGTLGANVTVKGPLSSPQVSVAAKLLTVSSSSVRLTAPVELDLDARYDGARADATLHGVRGNVEVLTAEAHVDVPAADLLAETADLPWDASAKAHVSQFPLVTVGPLDDRQIRGHLSGDFELDGLHKDAKAKAAFEVSDLKVGEATYPNAKATVVADGKEVRAEARLDQADGYGALKASVAASWGSALYPVPDPQHTLDIALSTKHFRAAVLLPFVQGSLDELDGVLDGEAKATVDPRNESVHVQGELALTQGLFELATFGGELHDVSAKIKVTPDGALTIDDFTAQGLSGLVTASASARLNGLRLQAANASVRIPKSRPFPLSVNGSLVGSIDGTINLKESMAADGHTVEIKADIPTFHLLVPESGSQDVQALGPIAGVEIGRRETPGGEFIVAPTNADEVDVTPTKARAADATVVKVETHLGNDVSIHRGSDLRVDLSGGPTVTVSDTTHVSGQIQLRGGVLNLYGKTFDIETGTVTFVGDDTSNPQVRVTAGWTAADGTQVKADFIGPLKTGKVTLRSEPPLGQNDIVQLLLFGTTNGQVATASATAPAGAYSAGGVAGNIATQPLNRALDQFGLSAVTAKVDTSSADAKPEVDVQIAKTISVELAHVLYLGPPPPGTAPDTTLVTLDWHFLKKWSLLATVGNAGSTIVDMVWQYRY